MAVERATFQAEAIAIGDLANECSFVPKGARIEDRFDHAAAGVHTVYAKIGITFEECEEAKRTVDPEKLHALANVAMTEELKRYQDIFYVAQAPTADVLPTAPPSSETRVASIQSTPEFFVARQEVVYAKQTVILAPVDAYPVGSPQHTQFVQAVSVQSTQIQQYEATNPTVRSGPTTWSAVERNPGTQFPQGFRHNAWGPRQGYTPFQNRPGGYRMQSAPGTPATPQPLRRRRRHRYPY